MNQKELDIIKKYDDFNILGIALFMNDGYCYLDDDGMPTNSPLNLSKKWKPWTYQINLYNVLLEAAGINTNNKNIELLDVACGQGGGVSFYKDYYKFKSVFGVDLNPNHIKHAAQRDGNVSFINASATDIPLPDNKFNIITCLEAETYFEPLDKYCQQVHRLLKEDGYLIHSSPALSINKNIFEKYFEIIKIKNIHNNVGMGCALSKQIFRNNKMLREIYINDEYRNLFGDKIYEIYVMRKL
jgi:SAM-dependent methyltransferase